jgi:hypothetical protein
MAVPLTAAAALLGVHTESTALPVTASNAQPK